MLQNTSTYVQLYRCCVALVACTHSLCQCKQCHIVVAVSDVPTRHFTLQFNGFNSIHTTLSTLLFTLRSGIDLRSAMKLIKNLPRPLSVRFRRPKLKKWLGGTGTSDVAASQSRRRGDRCVCWLCYGCLLSPAQPACLCNVQNDNTHDTNTDTDTAFSQRFYFVCLL